MLDSEIKMTKCTKEWLQTKAQIIFLDFLVWCDPNQENLFIPLTLAVEAFILTLYIDCISVYHKYTLPIIVSHCFVLNKVSSSFTLEVENQDTEFQEYAI